MGSLNRVSLLGRLTKDPEVRRTTAGTAIANLTVATSETWKDRNTGERKERSEFHRVVIFNENLAGIAEKYLKKGSQVLVEGQLQTRKWTDQSGADRYSTEVVVQGFDGRIVLVDRAPVSDSRPQQAAPRPSQATRPPTSTFVDDEIPF